MKSNSNVISTPATSTSRPEGRVRRCENGSGVGDDEKPVDKKSYDLNAQNPNYVGPQLIA